MYAEELFSRRSTSSEEMADQGAFGKSLSGEAEREALRAHSDWFWDVNRSGGGALMIWAAMASLSATVPGRPAIQRFMRRWELRACRQTQGETT